MANELSQNMLIRILSEVANNTRGKSLSSKSLTFVQQVASLLAEQLDEQKIQVTSQDEIYIYLPDEDGIMRVSSQLACDKIQGNWIESLTAYKEHFDGFFLHKSISRHIAISLGVHPLLDAVLQRYEDKSFLCGKEYYQHEDLCRRLSGILRKYLADITIFKEFIQNANDARATEIVFVLDHQTNYSDQTLFSSCHNWKKLQHTPALCIVNNRKFSEDDIIGLSKLGSGAKGESVGTIGRFGMGFNAAYHVTDCPSFLSCGESGKPENLCVLDPTKSFLGNAPGKRWNLEEEVKEFEDQFKPYLRDFFPDMAKLNQNVFQTINDSGYVVFRLPLTRVNSGSTSQTIGDNVFGTEDIKQLLCEFKSASCDMLLFLNHIRSISAFEISSDGNCSLIFSTFAKIPAKYLEKCRKFDENFSNEISQPASFSVFHEIEITQATSADKMKDSKKWIVQKHGTFGTKCYRLQQQNMV